jgi:hypothetical protein
MEGERVYDKQTTDEIKEDIRSQMKSEESIDFKLDLEVSRPIFLKHHQLYLSFFSVPSPHTHGAGKKKTKNQNNLHHKSPTDDGDLFFFNDFFCLGTSAFGA